MDCLTAISTRRSVRAYRPDPIPDEVLKKIMTAALMAPSADDLQPWFFALLKSQGAIRDLTGILRPAPERLKEHLEEQ